MLAKERCSRLGYLSKRLVVGDTIARQKKATIVAKIYRGDAREEPCEAVGDLKLDSLVMGSRGLTTLQSVECPSLETTCTVGGLHLMVELQKPISVASMRDSIGSPPESGATIKLKASIEMPGSYRLVKHSKFLTSVEAQDYSSDSSHVEPNPRIEVRRHMHESAKLGNLDKALRALAFLKPSILDYNGMLHSYFKSSSISFERVTGIFQKLKRFGPSPNFWTFSIMSNGLCSLGLLKHSSCVVEDMCNHGFVPSFYLLMKLMKKSLSSDRFEISIRVLELMLRFDYTPSLVVVNRLIARLSRGNRVHEAYHVFLVMLEMGLVPDAYTCNSLLFSVCRSNWCWQTLPLFYRFRKSGFVPTEYSYTSLVMGFGKKGLRREIDLIMEEMRRDGCFPTVVTYTVLIKCLCKYKLVDEALRILIKDMSNEGCEPDVVTYNVLFGALISLNRVKDSDRLCLVMEENGIIADQYTYCAIATSLLKNEHVSKSLDLLYQAVRDNVMDIVTWNIILRGLCVENRVRDAIATLSCMIKRGFVPNNVTCNIVLKGICLECIDKSYIS
ncbi:pentatricopeptide repeat-containing protein At1g06580-like isoform X2 [Asparagus officinalis]|uniref:pentatricopeptide repeat-containing protein At1g06580-like isoform X2 n=1 Tax=Asparagus officinalis TaxID=4686 RepID=UPI00098E3799|nr:pentatricopeptide repeat-containing protein At1g06580-like isoform X2 [Asparagus officinalis]